MFIMMMSLHDDEDLDDEDLDDLREGADDGGGLCFLFITNTAFKCC